jgi:probable HAF family extracellular repeat protein
MARSRCSPGFAGEPADGSILAEAINASGHVVGAASPPTPAGGTTGIRAVLWTPSNVLMDLGTLGGPNSHAFHINASDQVVGTSDAPGGTKWFLWSAGSGMQDLAATIGAWYIYDVVGINDAGQIAGTYLSPDTLVHAFLYTPRHGHQGSRHPRRGSEQCDGAQQQRSGRRHHDHGRERGAQLPLEPHRRDGRRDRGHRFTRIRLLNNNLQTIVGSRGWSDIDDQSLPRLIQLGFTPNAAPVARFTWSCVQLTCTFDASTSTDDKGIVSYAWTWGKTPYNKGSGREPDDTVSERRPAHRHADRHRCQRVDGRGHQDDRRRHDDSAREHTRRWRASRGAVRS